MRRIKTERGTEKTWLVYCTGKRNVFSFDLKSTEGFCQRGRGKSFTGERPRTEKSREPAVGSLVPGIWRLTVSEAAREGV